MLEPLTFSLTASATRPFSPPLSPHAPADSATELAFWRIRRRTLAQAQQALKNAGDRLLAAALLLAAAPAMAFIALAIAIATPGPVFYRSPRIGRHYAPFHMLKFRTMRVDADAARDALRAEANLTGELFKLADDPRVTPLGRFLRATSLDELPQLVNVLCGDMSLVGPRPLPPDESGLFRAPYTLRFQVLPGITGIWQVKGRSDASFQRLCELELGYLQRWTLWEDIKILGWTLPAVLLRKGAR
ncbi:MAG: sugar transferase [Vampirovibrionales bacterium]|nr:sugar transferase [Vampirovibrionales bacterium]